MARRIGNEEAGVKRICCFCETWESGGIESVLTNLLLHMDRSELEIDIVAVCVKESVFTERLQAAGIRFYELSGSLYSFLKNYSMFKELTKERNYDVLHLNAFQSLSFFYLLLAKQCGIPKRIAHSHNTALRKSTGQFLKLWIHKLSRFFLTGYATDLWACSGEAARFLFSSRELKRQGYSFIPNGIDVERFRFNPEVREQVRKELGCEGKLVIGNVGRLCYQKNQEFLLDIFAEVYAREPNSVLLLVGDGEDHAMLEERVNYLGIQNAVIFYGTCQKVEQLYWAMDVFVFPSRFEGLGMAAVEAQAAGLPVVCSEAIPQEARRSEMFCQVDLKNGSGGWADEIQRLLSGTISKEAPDIGAFSIQQVTGMIEAAYKNG